MLILGTHCNKDKALQLAIKAIFGINTLSALKICALIGVSPYVKLGTLKASRLERLNKVCRDELSTELSRYRKDNIKELIEMKHYKGVRHMFGLPARGQRTRTNASTAKKLSIIKKAKPNRINRL